jgi:hypothetical protein
MQRIGVRAGASFCGIDVAKDRLDVMVLPEELCWSVVNNAAGWLVAKLRGFRIAASGIEASGRYERGVVRSLLAAGISVRQINPFKLRQFAKACGVLAKNDRLDARMIALFVATMPTRPAQRYEAVERLACSTSCRPHDRPLAQPASRVKAAAARSAGARSASLDAALTMGDPDSQHVVRPDGSPLTIADLPAPDTKRWVIRLKAEVVAASRYTLTVDEFLSWQHSIDRRGLPGGSSNIGPGLGTPWLGGLLLA